MLRFNVIQVVLDQSFNLKNWDSEINEREWELDVKLE